eukprot:TRINITY_DN101154_c0_g1_i2.p1 TRINITY_DN101154_c0_g1~~TRINITY_DN101154_c0_g1_i2.p1  ORF type:complete len:107 (+),score=5.84 TRINITY_DN101154_c0_g1_i2:33-323(+)
MSVIAWDSGSSESITQKYDHHSEFVLGLDFNIFRENLIASCSWDETVSVFSLAEKDPFKTSSSSTSVSTETLKKTIEGIATSSSTSTSTASTTVKS